MSSSDRARLSCRKRLPTSGATPSGMKRAANPARSRLRCGGNRARRLVIAKPRNLRARAGWRPRGERKMACVRASAGSSMSARDPTSSTAQADVSIESGPRSRDRVLGLRQFCRRLPDPEETVPVAMAVGDEPDRVAAETAEMGIDDADRGADGDGRLDGVAARLQDVETGPGRQDMRARRHSVSAARDQPEHRSVEVSSSFRTNSGHRFVRRLVNGGTVRRSLVRVTGLERWSPDRPSAAAERGRSLRRLKPRRRRSRAAPAERGSS